MTSPAQKAIDILQENLAELELMKAERRGVVINLKEIVDKCPNTYAAHLAGVTLKVMGEG